MIAARAARRASSAGGGRARDLERLGPSGSARVRRRRRCDRRGRSRAARRSGSPTGRTRCCGRGRRSINDLDRDRQPVLRRARASRRRSTAPRGASARPRPGRTRSCRAGRPRGRPATAARTYADTSAMCTQTRQRSSSSRAAEIASSKSRALTGSIVNVGSERRSRRPAATRTDVVGPGARPPRAPRARPPDRTERRSPRSTISASITSRATSGRPIRRAIVARPAAASVAARARRAPRQVADGHATISADHQPRARLEERLGDEELAAPLDHGHARSTGRARAAAGRAAAGLTGPRRRRRARRPWSAWSIGRVRVAVGRVHVRRDPGSLRPHSSWPILRRPRGCGRSA